MSKFCKRCGTSKPYTAFTTDAGSVDGRRWTCKSCTNEQQRARHGNTNGRSQRAYMVAVVKAKRDYLYQYYEQHPCIDCGTKDVRVLQSDHTRDKKYSIGLLVANSNSLALLIDELAKCETRCANCHQIKTQSQLGFWRYDYHQLR